MTMENEMSLRGAQATRQSRFSPRSQTGLLPPSPFGLWRTCRYVCNDDGENRAYPSCANCPSGYFVARWMPCLVGQITTMLSHIPPRQEGRIATVTRREVGCDGLLVLQRAVRELTNN